ncbi:uncharacterized protein [Palaemon carinicauda]|uniref:uncharacterized protein isoform X2 n=1 Tax=Palaemon carinicauda TaxID=392227 RepID=UPI0035B5E199
MEERKMKHQVQHAPSQMLSQDANTKFFTLLEAKTQALCAAFVSVVISKPPERPDWKPYRSGIAALIKDHNRKSYYVQIYDIVDWEKVREEELTKGTPYHVSLPNFHQFEASKGKAMGLKFSLEKEAKTFAQIARDITMTGHYKDSSLFINSNDRRSTGDASDVKTIPTAPPPLRTNQNQTLPRLKRPKSMLREAPKSPPPPPPSSTKNVTSSSSPLPSPPEPPPPRSTGITSLPSTPVNKNAPLSVSGPLPLQSPVTTAPPLPATLNRKKKITKDMIGVPTNFQHVCHIGFDPEVTLDDKMLKDMMNEPIMRPNASRHLPAPPPPPDNKGLTSLPVSQALPPRQEEAAIVDLDEHSSKEEEETPVCEETSNRSLAHLPVSQASPPRQEKAATVDSDKYSTEEEEVSVCEEPRNRSLAYLPVSQASPPRQEEATTVDADEHCSEKEETPVCEEPRELALETPSNLATKFPVTQVNDTMQSEIEFEKLPVKNIARENEFEVQTTPPIDESESYTKDSETSVSSKKDHVVGTSNSTDGNDLVNGCNSELESSENTIDSDPVQSLRLTQDSTKNTDPISIADSPSLPGVNSTQNDHLAVERNSSLVESDQKHQENQNNNMNTVNCNSSLQATESSDYDAEILNSLNELEAMLEEVSTLSSESAPSQTKTESGEEMSSNNNQTTDDIESSCESYTNQSSLSSTSLYTYDPAQESHDAPDHIEMKKIIDDATTHSNLVLSAESLQTPEAPARNRRKKSKQASPPPPPPTPTEPEELKNSYL